MSYEVEHNKQTSRGSKASRMTSGCNMAAAGPWVRVSKIYYSIKTPTPAKLAGQHPVKMACDDSQCHFVCLSGWANMRHHVIV